MENHQLHKLHSDILVVEAVLVLPVTVVVIGSVLILIGLWLMVAHVLHLLILYICIFLYYVAVKLIIEQIGNHDYWCSSSIVRQSHDFNENHTIKKHILPILTTNLNHSFSLIYPEINL